jgi:hypothetical protein
VLMSLLLDLANIFGGFLLSIGILQHLPYIGSGLNDFMRVVAPFRWIVGIVTLVAAGYFLINHLVSGPHLFHFEVVGIGVGLALLWDRLTSKQTTSGSPALPDGDVTEVIPGPQQSAPAAGSFLPPRPGRVEATVDGEDLSSGPALLLAIFGLIAVVVGIQGMVTPN